MQRDEYKEMNAKRVLNLIEAANQLNLLPLYVKKYCRMEKSL